MASNNIIKRLRDEGVLYWYFDYRTQGNSDSPGYAGTGGISARHYVNNSSTADEGDSAPYQQLQWALPDPGYVTPTTTGIVFDTGQYLQTPASSADTTLPHEDFSLAVLVDDMQFENNDTINVAPNNREYAVLISRNEEGGSVNNTQFAIFSYYRASASEYRLACRCGSKQMELSETTSGLRGARLIGLDQDKAASGNMNVYLDGYMTSTTSESSYNSSKSTTVGNSRVNYANGTYEATYSFPARSKVQAVLLTTRVLTAAEWRELYRYLVEVKSCTFDRAITGAQGARVEYVFHAGGMPWGLTTSKDAADALDAHLVYKRRVFGHAQRNPTTDGGSSGARFADSVPVFDLLYPPGSQSMKTCESDAEIKGGSWSITLAHEDIGYSWPYRNGRIYGIDGIHALCDPQADDSIYTAELLTSIDTNDTTIQTITSDAAAALATKLAASTRDWEELWIGGECVAATSVADGAATEWNQHDVTVVRGLYRSRPQSHLVDDYPSQNTMLADAPIGGIVGRGAYLWAIPLGATGAPLDEPVLIRHGIVKNGIETAEGTTTISCGAWVDWLDTTIAAQDKVWQQARYVITRGPKGEGKETTGMAWSTTSAGSVSMFSPPAHLYLREYSSGTWTTHRIWICDSNTTRTFDTLAELRTAIEDELAACTAGSASQYSGDGSAGNALINLAHDYRVDEYGIVHLTPQTYGNETRIGGPLAQWLFLGWGDLATSVAVSRDRTYWAAMTSGEEQDMSVFGDGANMPGGIGGFYVDNTPDSGWMSAVYQATVGGSPTGIVLRAFRRPYEQIVSGGISVNGLPEFMSMFCWNHDGNKSAQYINMHSRDSLFTEHTFAHDTGYGFTGHTHTPAGDNPRLYFAPKSSPTILANGEKFSIGNSADGSARYAKGGVASTGTDGYFPYIQLSNAYTSWAYSGANAIWQPKAAKIFSLFGALYFVPYVHGVDPWAGAPIADIDQAIYSGVVIQAVLGDATVNSLVSINRLYQKDYVPDAVEDSIGDHQTSINYSELFGTLDRFTSAVGSGSWSYKITLDGEENLSELLQTDLQLFGAYPTWYLDMRKRQHVMGFRSISAASISEARSSGRIIDSRTVAIGQQAKIASVGEALVGSLLIKCNYDGKDFLGDIVVRPNRLAVGTANTASQRETRTKNWSCSILKSLASSPENQAKLMSHFVDAVLSRLAKPRPEIKYDTTIEALVKFGVGMDCLINDPYVHSPYTGALGLTNQGAIVYGADVDLGKGTASITVRLTDTVGFGIAPALRVAASASTITSPGNPGTVSITPVAREFHRTDDRTDLSCFDCLDWSRSTNRYDARDCDCDDYHVIAVEEDSRVAVPYQWTIGSVDVSAGTAVLTGNTANWDVAKNWILFFDTWNNPLETCQRYWCYLADENNELVDDSSVHTHGHRWT